MVRLWVRQRLVCLRTGTDPLVGPKGWKGTEDLVQDNIKVDLEKWKRWGTDWINLAEDRIDVGLL